MPTRGGVTAGQEWLCDGDEPSRGSNTSWSSSLSKTYAASTVTSNLDGTDSQASTPPQVRAWFDDIDVEIASLAALSDVVIG